VRQGLTIPRYIREVVEAIAFKARSDQRIDRRSGVSQRLPISCLENVASNAERRSVLLGESEAVARVLDVYAALPAITGKLELEYEGELKGAGAVARDLIRQAVQAVFRMHVPQGEFKQVTEWFELGGTLNLADLELTATLLQYLEGIQGLMELARPFGIGQDSSAAERLAAAEFVLEGLCSLDKISRTEERGYGAVERNAGERPGIDDLYRDYALDPKRYRKKNLN
jgi:magnesium chelatase subunit I